MRKFLSLAVFALCLLSFAPTFASMPSEDEIWDRQGKYLGPIGNQIRSANGQSGTTPTCATNCGTNPSIVGTNSSMFAYLGVGLASPITITFGNAFAAIPSCTAANAQNASNYVTRVSPTTTNVAIYFASGPTNGDIINVQCIGRQ